MFMQTHFGKHLINKLFVNSGIENYRVILGMTTFKNLRYFLIILVNMLLVLINNLKFKVL